MRTLIKLVMIVFFLAAGVAEGIEVGGADLPDTLSAGNTKLILNGAGLRKKLFVKVYAEGLYLEEKQSDPTAIIQADRPMAIRMHFIYDGVTPKQLVDTWNEGFAASTADKGASIRDRLNTFNGFFTEKAQKGDRYDLIYLTEEGVTLFINQKRVGTVPGLDFKKALYAIWLGEKPADAGLKAGLLGK
ncbi:MAG: chalcone isomerase [Desulfobacterales bacterium CG07_land_8_20_14_0_80_52_14]|nr:MAG: chalcone isomerase [Desulfobacterales bacterium CG23_combo_of_CG06-09_8_20_14_all_52_9]PIU50698.1 MAG: chalcone isomerase [Desulfobacterales bacterium CG07_land_8_20_14_0_80_52_14]